MEKNKKKQNFAEKMLEKHEDVIEHKKKDLKEVFDMIENKKVEEKKYKFL